MTRDTTQLALLNTSDPACPRCDDTGAIGEEWCTCPIADQRRTKLQAQHDAAYRVAMELHADTVARTERVIAGLLALDDDSAAQRVRRVLRVIALHERWSDVFHQVGRRRSRKERAADALATQLLAECKAARAALDPLDFDMYSMACHSEEVQGRLIAIVAEASA